MASDPNQAWSYLTLGSFTTNGIALLKTIAGIPSFEWVGSMPIDHIHDDTLQLICNLVNSATGAKPPVTVQPVVGNISGK